jgi:hypothetical protein
MFASPTIPTIDVDLPCATCDYNLRGLTRRDRCPECGAGVARSLAVAAHGLTRAERAWLWAQVRACYVLLVTAAWELVCGLGVFAAFGPRAGLATKVVGAVAASYGVWSLGRAEPDDADRQRPKGYFRRFVMGGSRQLPMRAGVAAWLTYPALIMTVQGAPDGLVIGVALSGVAGGTVATAAALVQLARLSSWFGWGMVSRQLSVLSIASTIVFLVRHLMVGFDSSSGSNVVPVLLDLRIVPLEMTWAARVLGRHNGEVLEALLPVLAGPAWSLWCAVLLAWLCWRLSMAVPRIARRIPASSLP